MLLAQFIELYQDYKNNEKEFTFVLYNKSQIRIENHDKTISFCPLTYVCFKENEKIYNVGEFDKAGRDLRLSDFYVDKIANTADKFEDRYSLYDPLLRKELLT